MCVGCGVWYITWPLLPLEEPFIVYQVEGYCIAWWTAMAPGSVFMVQSESFRRRVPGSPLFFETGQKRGCAAFVHRTIKFADNSERGPRFRIADHAIGYATFFFFK